MQDKVKIVYDMETVTQATKGVVTASRTAAIKRKLS